MCNSLVWTCSLSGKTGLTFSEAIESAEKARQILAKFPPVLEKALVFLMSLTKRGNIKDLTDDMFTFTKDRFFIGEQVQVVVGHAKSDIHKSCKITDVLPPKDECDRQNTSKYKYLVESQPGKTQTIIATQIR